MNPAHPAHRDPGIKHLGMIPDALGIVKNGMNLIKILVEPAGRLKK